MMELTWGQVIAYGIMTFGIIGAGIIALLNGHTRYNGSESGYRYKNHHHTARRLAKGAAIAGAGLIILAQQVSKDMREMDD